ncbi:ThiF family adenylyltransferase [Microbacterium schleiferi]|uniref:ThiF family adenylyltransferase n=1 Tax=Microbacterium schleiferi TaxID=69362 RepID=A0A7S8MXI1_9MICO|nr:ThiF family adenylyltransferase [Microbacterium schleiferi]QPE05059.1 ThiF family adenylyltransferase [Microbacterium schleiferi]
MSLPPLVEPVDALTDAERDRTARHRKLFAIGDLGQRRLAAARVAVVGAGGLGSSVILGLAAAGVGTIGIIDDDVVDLSNLHRQIIHSIDTVGDPKTESAATRARGLAPGVRIIEHPVRLTAANAREILAGYDLVLDGSDTFETRDVVDAAAAELRLPVVWGSVLEFWSQVTVFWSAPPAGNDPVRLSDLFPAGSTGQVFTCEQVGVLASVCMQTGSLMASEAIKLIVGEGRPLLGRIAVIDALAGTMRELEVRSAASTHMPMPA